MTDTTPPDPDILDARLDIAAALGELDKVADAAEAARGHLQAALISLKDRPAPDPDPVPGEADILAWDEDAPIVIYGPVGLPLGALPRAGGALDHDGAPDTAKYYRCASGVQNGATRGTAPIFGVGDGRTMEIHLRAQDKVAAGGGTGMAMKWFYLPEMAPKITVEFWQTFTEYEFGWTNKALGFGRFEGAPWGDPGWKDFPAGGVHPLRTCMVRDTGWKYKTEDRSQARLATVVKAGRPILPSVNPKVWTSAKVRAWPGAEGPTNPNTSVSFVDDTTGPPPVGAWIGTRMIGSFGTHGRPDGWLEVWRSIRHEPWKLTIRVTGIDWIRELGPAGTTGAKGGFNMVCLSFMCGGDTTDYAPRNPARTDRRLLRDLAVVPEVWRPKATV